jgi:hypothetical protein
VMACVEELLHANASDVAGTASDKNIHISKNETG